MITGIKQIELKKCVLTGIGENSLNNIIDGNVQHMWFFKLFRTASL